MRGVRSFKCYLKKELKKREFKKAFQEEEVYANIAIQIAKLREGQGLTQSNLARVLHTTQQTISRLEDPDNGSLSLRTLIKIAGALNKKINVQFVK